MKKRPEKYREITLEVGPWNTYVSVMIGGERRQRRGCLERCKVHVKSAESFLSHMAALDPRGAVTMYDGTTTPGNVFVYFPRTPQHDDPQDIGAVTHELLHVTHKILMRKGVKLCEESEEAFTYLAEFLVRELWAKLLHMKHVKN